MAFLLGDNQQVELTVTYVDEAGNPGVVDEPPVWETSNAALLTVVESDDGLSATVSAVGPLGSAQVSVTADADLGSGVTEIIGTLDVEVVGSEAVSAVIQPGTPEHKPATAP